MNDISSTRCRGAASVETEALTHIPSLAEAMHASIASTRLNNQSAYSPHICPIGLHVGLLSFIAPAARRRREFYVKKFCVW